MRVVSGPSLGMGLCVFFALTTLAVQIDGTTDPKKLAKELLRASQRGKTTKVRELIASGAPVNCQSERGWTPLHRASYYGYNEIVTLLIKNGANPNLKDTFGNTPLIRAARRNKMDTVRALVEAKADTTARSGSPKKMTAAEWAEREGNHAVAKFLVQSQEVQILRASRNGKTTKVRELIASGTPVDCQSASGKTPLYLASHFGHIEIVTLLIKNGANPNIADRFGNTPLIRAAQMNKMNIVRALIEANADTTARGGSPKKMTAAEWAEREGNHDVAKFLVSACVEYAVQTQELLLASRDGNMTKVRELVASGAPVNCQSERGWTPLHRASEYGHIEIVTLLIKNCANPNLKDRFGITPLILAARMNKEDIVRALVEANADTTARGGSPKKLTAAEWAKKMGNHAVANFLANEVQMVEPTQDLVVDGCKIHDTGDTAPAFTKTTLFILEYLLDASQFILGSPFYAIVYILGLLSHATNFILGALSHAIVIALGWNVSHVQAIRALVLRISPRLVHRLQDEDDDDDHVDEEEEEEEEEEPEDPEPADEKEEDDDDDDSDDDDDDNDDGNDDDPENDAEAKLAEKKDEQDDDDDEPTKTDSSKKSATKKNTSAYDDDDDNMPTKTRPTKESATKKTASANKDSSDEVAADDEEEARGSEAEWEEEPF